MIRSLLRLARPLWRVRRFALWTEGKKQDYTGLHAWNLRKEDGALILANERERIDVGAHFAGRAAVGVMTKGDLVVAELRRLTSPASAPSAASVAARSTRDSG